jgi:response regulator RpfG family c-di-GMP phosphodiesterase
MWQLTGYKLVVLNLFFLPVVLAGFFLGRYRAGVLASFAVISASVVTALNLADFASLLSPLVIGLAVTLWAAVLGLVALMVGTLSDERAQTMRDLHEAHVGVVEVLARYLQSANAQLKDRSKRVAELSEAVARELKMPVRDCDDIRVAALLYDMENIEITARVIRRAVGEMETQQEQHSFHGSELATSLGTVLSGAFPLLTSQSEGDSLGKNSAGTTMIPTGAHIIRAVRGYDSFMHDVKWGRADASVRQDAIRELRRDSDAECPGYVVDALERVVFRDASRRSEDQLLAVAR